ncbi:MAG: hypothetical protein PSV16_07550 [Flavobacterium sp.]|nr:hypothetical protein [Flavobacterium sp.]
MDQQTIEKGKTAAISSYILLVGVLIALSINSEDKNPYASFHIRQGLGLSITFVSLGLIIANFESIMIAAPMWIFISVLMIFGIFNAAQGSTRPLPLVGNLFQKWFKNI